MPRKPKFRPKITWVKLNPEQAVLSCNCYNTGTHVTGNTKWSSTWIPEPACSGPPGSKGTDLTDTGASTVCTSPGRFLWDSINPSGAIS